MNTNDHQAISDLFARLSKVEQQAPARDPEAERLIAESIARQPGAPYYMAQTVVVQEHALKVAQDRITRLEAELAEARKAAQDGGFLSGLFGSETPMRRAPTPARALPSGASGGFLAGAAQTAIGVAGGMLLANTVVGSVAGAAQAAEAEISGADSNEEIDTDGGGLGDLFSDW